MQFKGIKRGQEGKFITRYDIMYETKDGQLKNYEMISRDQDIRSYEDLISNKPNAVVLIMTDESGERILLNREFRLATGRWIYNFPAGLIDPGETPGEAAKRELMEETGLTLTSVRETLGVSYSAVGFSNETNVCVIGTAAGSFRPSTSGVEEIEPGWFTRKEVLELIRKEPFAARTEGYCYAWASAASSALAN